jgi:basic amino acid/polyamine antiporter, APA family
VISVAMVGSLFAADAWNNVTFVAGEVRDPERNLPRSLALGTSLVIAIYLLANVAYLCVLPLRGTPDGATVLDRGIQFAAEDRVATAVAEVAFGPSGGVVMALAVMISTFGCNNGLILAGARIYYAMARDRMFFASVASLNRHLSPALALLVQGAWASMLCLSGTYGQLLDFLIFSVLLFYILTISGIFVLRRTRPEMARPYRTWGYPVLPAVYIAMALFIEVQLLRYKPQYTWPGLIIVLLGMPVYWAWKKVTEQRT